MAATTFEDAERMLQSIGEQFEEIPYTLQELAADVENLLKRNARVGETGRMRDLTSVTFSNGLFAIEMIDYAYYNIFGVTGTNRTGLTYETEIQNSFPFSSNPFMFTQINHPGILGIPQSASAINSLLKDGIADAIVEAFEIES